MGWLCPGRTEPAVGPFTALLILAQVQPPWVVAARYLPSFLPFPGSIICNEIGATRNSNKSKSNSRRSMISSLRLKSGRQKAFLSLPGYVGSSVMGPSLSLGRSILSSLPTTPARPFRNATLLRPVPCCSVLSASFTMDFRPSLTRTCFDCRKMPPLLNGSRCSFHMCWE